MILKLLNIDNLKEIEKAREFLEMNSRTTISMLPQYIKIARDTYSFDVYYLSCYEDAELKGIASFYKRPSLFEKQSLVSIPGGFWAKDETSEKFLIKELEKIAEDGNLNGPCLKDIYKPLSDFGSPYVLYKAMLKLPENEEALAKSLPPNIRRDVRTARKNGLKVVETDDLKGFYNVFSRRMHDLGTPRAPYTFFKNMKKNLGDKMNLLTLQRNGDCIGAAILLKYTNTVSDPFLSCQKDSFRHCSNVLLYYEMLKWAIDNKFEYFDLGRSQPASGNEKFKLRFGSELVPLYSYGLKTFQKDSFLRKTAAFCWRKIPLPLANYVAPKIRRYIPYG